ncbi:ParA family protein [endosymbiont of Ridgeia piscesae]|jgi:chromosome partitioning protein|uniref:Cellulose biosynthesis protein BcsQ n=1 Tax=endosymbiont of Ridgeia piscesae TaxID=54398 RepID=A0A0T5Z0V8_9GAMM|nr:ParA family protein [endosymbiont of Ridgeia piscesae]KRT56415.1 Cellulose biosynthesis protein BcsQ [endosymbiont of Ridgeia piscesae]KRT59638.1 chromosome partitioning protein [endosymbiont of Ridgeia piscesae]
MRRIAVINQKGGVGKTTITTNLGHALALKGYRVTVVDLDPQGQLAASLGMFRPPVEGVDQVLLNGAELESAVINTRDLLQLVSAGNNLQQVEELRGGGAARASILKNALEGQFSDQDFILFDCPPSAGILVSNAMFAADEVLIPVSGDYLSLSGLAKMMMTLKRFEPYLEKPHEKWIEMSRVYPRRRLFREVCNKLLGHFPGQVLANPIKEAAVMAECPGVGRTIFEYRRSSQSAKEFEALATDLLERRTM